MASSLSYKSVAPHLFNLRLSGYYQIDPESPKLYRNFHRAYMGFVLSLILCYTLQQALKVYEVRADMGQVMGTMFLFLTHTDAIYKQILLWARQDDIESLLQIMRGPFYNQDRAEHHIFLLKTAKYARLLLYSDNALAIATCFLWFVYPIYLHLSGVPFEYTIWLPYDENKDPWFFFTAIYSWITTTWLAFSNTTMDVLIATFLAQARTQLSILSINLSTLVDECYEDVSATTAEFSSVFFIKFKNVLQHYDEIIKYTKIVENIFGTVLAYQFLIGGWIICTSVYRLVDIDEASVECFSMVSYIACMLFEIFIFCYYGSEVTHESTKIRDAVYKMKWTDIPLKNKKLLIVFMERIKRPIRIMAGSIIPLSNDTFVSIVKSSYSFYALLKSTSE